ncbi:uncharacterized protein LOC131693673 isoform X1 [Topomyia yanbarensis]|uniref:uncharacterized protein LOC131693294 isoform X1 n=1 Tax=Topomyia yanbarensis TaxID=2498891 RepID=UPI00273C1768|nr:uncharacterized protein LOC131693294 isoform X1 [Topomyia yanbarensis]XP_058837377.1 uncharacterized protein LOC131693513 isoform X1 [Topomyia yanbarensis]XP_058837695.1 uncharacterized protein LOC131693673 isoform X1 [Topomyia yanbarensis]
MTNHHPTARQTIASSRNRPQPNDPTNNHNQCKQPKTIRVIRRWPTTEAADSAAAYTATTPSQTAATAHDTVPDSGTNASRRNHYSAGAAVAVRSHGPADTDPASEHKSPHSSNKAPRSPLSSRA